MNKESNITEVSLLKTTLIFPDNGGRRSGSHRRSFSYSNTFPERRNVQDRRGHKDRRSGIERRKVIGAEITVNHRSIQDRRFVFKGVSHQI